MDFSFNLAYNVFDNAIILIQFATIVIFPFRKKSPSLQNLG